ncbi:hypothetical protein BGZ63DRAFT_378062 [Mariannaea sp. PMI_226]|nr:hypothetical protein BGZ63DRAFT_378062 [Mariannaea sp. PMI_226]
MATPDIPLNQRPKLMKPTLETPSHGSGGVFSLVCSTTINAPLAVITSALLDTRSYPVWNSFVSKISINSQPPAAASTPPPACLVGSSVLELETTLQKGTNFILHVSMDSKAKFQAITKNFDPPIVCTVLEDIERDGRPGVRVAWRLAGWMPGPVLKSERVQELVDVGGGVVEYRCWETFYGMLAYTVKSVVGESIMSGFGAWMDGLKEHSEKLAQEAEASSKQ